MRVESMDAAATWESSNSADVSAGIQGRKPQYWRRQILSRQEYCSQIVHSETQVV